MGKYSQRPAEEIVNLAKDICEQGRGCKFDYVNYQMIPAAQEAIGEYGDIKVNGYHLSLVIVYGLEIAEDLEQFGYITFSDSIVK